MRATGAALLLLLPLLLPGAGAEGTGLSDAAGDAVIVAGAGPARAPPADAGELPAARAADLLALRVEETADGLLLVLEVGALEGDPLSTASFVLFGWTGGEFALQMSYARRAGDERAAATLSRWTGEDAEPIAQLPLVVDVERATLQTSVPKAYLVDEEGRAPGRGDTLSFRSVESVGGGVGLFAASVRARDSMPDDGVPAQLVLEQGDHAQGDIVAWSRDPVRVSNGGATTFVFEATLRNIGARDDEYALAVADLPAGWNATLRSPLPVPANGERTVNVLVSVPFAHEHGGFSSFNLTVQSTQHAQTNAQIRMGVLHTPIPQPAGHHAELYLHARPRDASGALGPISDAAFPATHAWMNTDGDHADDAPSVAPADEGEHARWTIRLDPPLRLGLDFDLARLAELRASLLAQHAGEVELTASLLHVHEDERLLLAASAPATVALDAHAPTPLVLALTPTPESDYIPYRADANLQLELTATRPTPVPSLAPLDLQLATEDFRLALPLHEYHDRIAPPLEAAGTIELVAQSEVEKTGLPGSVLIYAFELRNGATEEVLVLDLAGNAAHEGTLIPRGPILLAPHERRNVTLAVEIPIEAAEGHEFEVLVFAHAQDDPSKMAIARTRTRATHDAAVASPDETHLLLDARAREAQVPAAELLAVLAALLIAAATSSPTKASRRRPRRR